MRKCIKCGEEKELELFRKRSIWRSHTCKKCYSQSFASGNPNEGRFKKGQTPWNKGKKAPPRRTEPRYKKKGRPLKSENRESVKAHIWSLKVKERDGFKCQICNCEEDLHSHHIEKWNINKEKRFDINNGITLCRTCHSREERLLETRMGLPGCTKRKKMK